MNPLRNDVYIRNFKRLIELGIINDKGKLQFEEAVSLESKPFMNLNIDHLSHKDKKGYTVISIAHNYIQNGDVMCEPDMEIKIIPDMMSIEALTYQLSSMGIYQQVYNDEFTKVNKKLKKDLNTFLEMWLKNLKAQKFKMPLEALKC